jgi:tetrahydromethanopterin S-methyltransferase subunit B
MDGAIDIKLMLTLAGMLVSVVSAAAIAKREIKLLADQAHDIEIRLRKLDQRVDKLENVVDTTQHRIGILAGMSSPDTMERRHREVERLRVEVDQLKREVMK